MSSQRRILALKIQHIIVNIFFGCVELLILMNFAMKKFLIFFALLIAVICVVLSACKSEKRAKQERWGYSENVFICSGVSAKRYHSTDDCSGLSRCRGEIQIMPVEEAEDEGKTPCRICVE